MISPQALSSCLTHPFLNRRGYSFTLLFKFVEVEICGAWTLTKDKEKRELIKN